MRLFRNRSEIIAVDAMGGDRAPGEVVAGANQAAEELGVSIQLVGEPDQLAPYISELHSRVTVVASDESITMHDDPVASVRMKPGSSLVRAIDLINSGEAHAMVSAGNTGAVMAAALTKLGRVQGVERPALAVPIPVPGHAPQLLIDGGSTVDCEPAWLVQWAYMGCAYARLQFGIEQPTCGLLSIGEEPGKGDALRKEAHALMQTIPGFIGNVEGSDLISDRPNVVIADGFTGNVALKTMERTMIATATYMLSVMTSGEETRRASDQLMPVLLDAAKNLQPENVGGAPLLGINGVCVVSHGSSSATAIFNAIRVARDTNREHVVTELKAAVAHAG